MTLSAQTPSVIMLKSMDGEDPIELHGEIIVGRGSMCDVILEKDRLSRQHARLSVGDGNLMVEDLNSTNGTYINDVKIDRATIAKHNDLIRFDRFAYQVCVSGGYEDAESTVTGQTITQEDEVLDAKTQVFSPPKSWALDDKKASEGTQVMSLDMLKQGQSANAGFADSIEATGPVLVGLSESIKGKVYRFNTRDKMSKWEIGRDENCEIHIDDGSVSNNHAQLVHEGLRWKLVDLMSANGTYVNGSKGLTSYLSSGDTVGFGKVEFVFKLGDDKRTSENLTLDSAGESSVNSWVLGLLAFAVTAGVLFFFLT